MVAIAVLNLVLDFDFVAQGCLRRPQAYGVVRSLRHHGDVGLALFGDSPPPRQNPQPQLNASINPVVRTPAAIRENGATLPPQASPCGEISMNVTDSGVSRLCGVPRGITSMSPLFNVTVS